jgi:hypothetical protein
MAAEPLREKLATRNSDVIGARDDRRLLAISVTLTQRLGNLSSSSPFPEMAGPVRATQV